MGRKCPMLWLLGVRLDLAGRKGQQDKPIAVRTDDPATEEFVVPITMFPQTQDSTHKEIK